MEIRVAVALAFLEQPAHIPRRHAEMRRRPHGVDPHWQPATKRARYASLPGPGRGALRRHQILTGEGMLALQHPPEVFGIHRAAQPELHGK